MENTDNDSNKRGRYSRSHALAGSLRDFARQFTGETYKMLVDSALMLEVQATELKEWEGLQDISFRMEPGIDGEGVECPPSPRSVREHILYLENSN